VKSTALKKFIPFCGNNFFRFSKTKAQQNASRFAKREKAKCVAYPLVNVSQKYSKGSSHVKSGRNCWRKIFFHMMMSYLQTMSF
jgi:hypothetical protein